MASFIFDEYADYEWQSEPPADAGELDSEDAQEAQEEAENGTGNE